MSAWVLVIHPGALGDILLAVPALRRLRAIYFSHRLVLACQPAAGQLLRECGVIDEWVAFESEVIRTLTFRDRSCVAMGKFPWLRQCELVVAWMNDQGGEIRGSLQQWGIPRVVVKSPFDPTVTALHQADRFYEVIIGEPGGEVEAPPLSLPPLTRQKAQQLFAELGIASHDPLLVVHPGSGSSAKCLRPQAMGSVIQQLVNDHWQVVLLEGPADRDHVQAILDMSSRPLPVVRNANLMLVASVLTHARMYLGHDSGITHLAALLGIPTLALFGPTDPARWGPRGASVLTLRGAPCQCASWEAVLSCSQRVCLNIVPERIVDLCRRWRSDDASLTSEIPRLVSTQPVC
ncbi:MAG: glycosyltransferase family 9 protein [Nitrospira sp.]|nr:glycosyltransferase family 9 protein [Nitrospira sp.]